ncbi:MAG: CPBP family intramembrane metalloprotease [Firmicutes bacterium]|nr:CPBP family intramembrane metalloprotease [Bacillota bacterium]
MRVKKLTVNEMIFSIICLTIIFFIGQGILRIIPLIIIILFGDITLNNDMEIERNKKFIYAFILVFILYMSIQGYYDYINISNRIGDSLFKGLLINLPVTMTIFTAYFFGVRIKDFNWKLSLSSLPLVLLVWLSIEIIPFMEYMRSSSITDFISNIIINVPFKIYYPSIVEEMIFRGLCFSGLLTIGLGEDKSNIIQAVVFGLIHILNYDQFSINIILLIVPQIYIGFLIGKIYINTKSLTPCIFLHSLIDSI